MNTFLYGASGMLTSAAEVWSCCPRLASDGWRFQILAASAGSWLRNRGLKEGRVCVLTGSISGASPGMRALGSTWYCQWRGHIYAWLWVNREWGESGGSPADCAPRTPGRTILAAPFSFSHLHSGFCLEREATKQVSLGGEELTDPGFPWSTLDSRKVRDHGRTWVPKVQVEHKVSP